MTLDGAIWHLAMLSFSFILPLTAQEVSKPNFSGTWKLNLKKSMLQIPAPSSTTFYIVHKDPKFHLTRTHVYGEKKDTWSIDLTTNGKEHYQKDGDFETRTRLYWEGSSLTLDMKLRNKAEEGTNVVRYSLTDGGRTFVAVERLRSPSHSHDNTWIFDKQ